MLYFKYVVLWLLSCLTHVIEEESEELSHLGQSLTRFDYFVANKFNLNDKGSSNVE